MKFQKCAGYLDCIDEVKITAENLVKTASVRWELTPFYLIVEFKDVEISDNVSAKKVKRLTVIVNASLIGRSFLSFKACSYNYFFRHTHKQNSKTITNRKANWQIIMTREKIRLICNVRKVDSNSRKSHGHLGFLFLLQNVTVISRNHSLFQTRIAGQKWQVLHWKQTPLQTEVHQFQATKIFDVVLCSWARHFTLTVPLSTQVYKWVTGNFLL